MTQHSCQELVEARELEDTVDLLAGNQAAMSGGQRAPSRGSCRQGVPRDARAVGGCGTLFSEFCIDRQRIT